MYPAEDSHPTVLSLPRGVSFNKAVGCWRQKFALSTQQNVNSRGHSKITFRILRSTIAHWRRHACKIRAKDNLWFCVSKDGKRRRASSLISKAGRFNPVLKIRKHSHFVVQFCAKWGIKQSHFRMVFWSISKPSNNFPLIATLGSHSNSYGNGGRPICARISRKRGSSWRVDIVRSILN